MINDNAKTPISSSPKPENAAQDSRKPNQNHDAAARSRSSQQILTTLTEWRRADNVARRPKRAAAATLPVLQRDGAMYAPALPRDLAVTFDATHVTRPDQVSLRQHEAKQSLSANPLRSGANHRITGCQLRTNAL